MLKRLLAAYRLELRLICLHWGYWIVYGAWAAFVLSNFQRPILEPARVLLLSGLGTGTVAIVSLIGLGLAGISVSRSTVTRFTHLELAFSTGAEIIVGCWLAVLTALSAFTLVPLGVTLFLGPLDSFLAALPVFLIETLVILAFVTSFVWVIQTTMGVRRWMYPLFVLLWIASALARNIFIDNGLQFPGANLLAFSFGNFSGYSEAFGRLQWGNLPLLFDLFYLGLSIALISVIVWFYQVRRFHRRAVGLASLTAATVVFTIVTGALYLLNVAAANEQIREVGRVIRTHIADVEIPSDLPYQFTDYTLTVDMAQPNQPQFEVEVDVVNTGEQPLNSVDFNLNEHLTVTSMNMPFERNRSFIEVSPPQPLESDETTTLQLSYSGTLWHYISQSGYPPLVSDFTHRDGLNLTAESFWYPVPGYVPMGWGLTGERGGVYQSEVSYVLSEAVPFRLQIINPGTFTYASNLPQIEDETFSSEGAVTVDLIGSPTLASARVSDTVTIIAAQSEIEPLTGLAATWFTPAWETVQRFLPQTEHLVMFVVSERAESFPFEGFYPSTAETVTVRFDPLVLYRSSEANDTVMPLLNMLDSLFYDLHPFVRDNIYSFLALYTLEEGDTVRMRERLAEEVGEPRSFLAMSFVSYAQDISQETRYGLTEVLITLYEREGQEGVTRLFERIYREREALADLTPEAVIDWVETYAE